MNSTIGDITYPDLAILGQETKTALAQVGDLINQRAAELFRSNAETDHVIAEYVYESLRMWVNEDLDSELISPALAQNIVHTMLSSIPELTAARLEHIVSLVVSRLKHKQTQLELGGRTFGLQYEMLASGEVTEGVWCDVYSVRAIEGKSQPEAVDFDYAVVTMQPGTKTPVQTIRTGARTLEGLQHGQGALKIILGSTGEFAVITDFTQQPYLPLSIGDTMQWVNDSNEQVQFGEICFPPYAAGRYHDHEVTDIESLLES